MSHDINYPSSYYFHGGESSNEKAKPKHKNLYI